MITQRGRGFTLVELMITLTMVAFLSVIALPSFTKMIKNNRLTTKANDFILVLNLARSEAVKRGTSVTLTANGGNWGTGWTVRDASSQTLRIGDPLQGDMTLTSGNTNTIITYQVSGAATGNPTALPGNFDLCDDRTGETGRRISISVTGRISVADISCS